MTVDLVDPVGSARAALVRTFRWTQGHADFAPVFRDATTLATFGPALAAPFAGAGITVVVAIEARGFVLGALTAEHLGVGLVLARKHGAIHPGDKATVVSAPDWRGRRVRLSLVRLLAPGDRVLLVDDWIETGSQARAVKEAVTTCGAGLVGTSVLVDDTSAAVRGELNVVAVVLSSGLPLNDEDAR
jgi:adenine phosphoribosyltransferase